jgi:hypothetical protein
MFNHLYYFKKNIKGVVLNLQGCKTEVKKTEESCFSIENWINET